MPEIQDSIEFSLHCLFGHQRRRTKYDLVSGGEVEPMLAPSRRLNEKPALVEWPTCYANLSALKIVDAPYRRLLLYHDGADGSGIGRHRDVVALRSLTRDPQPIGNDHVDFAC